MSNGGGIDIDICIGIGWDGGHSLASATCTVRVTCHVPDSTLWNQEFYIHTLICIYMSQLYLHLRLSCVYT